MTNEEMFVCTKETSSILTIWYRKHRWLGHVLTRELSSWQYRREMLGKATQGMKRIKLLHDIMEGRDYEQLIHLVSDRSSETAGNSRRLKQTREGDRDTTV